MLPLTEETWLSLSPIRELLWDLVPISTDRYLQSLQRALRRLCLDLSVPGNVLGWKMDMKGKGEWDPDEQEHKPQMPLQVAKGAAFVGGRRAEVARVEVSTGVKGSSAPECSTGCGE